MYTFATSLVRNNGDGSFTLIPLPVEAQLAPVYGILASDIDGDGHTDLCIAYGAGQRVGVLLGNGDGTFQGPSGFQLISTFFTPTAIAVAELEQRGVGGHAEDYHVIRRLEQG